MSDDQNEPHPLLGLLELVESGNSSYGPIGSPKQVERVAELRAEINLSRELGELPPAKSWDTRVREQRFARDFPGGDPSALPQSDDQVAHLQGKIEALAALDERTLKEHAKALADDLAYTASAISLPYAAYRRETGDYMPGYQQLDALVSDAMPAVRHFAKTSEMQTKTIKALRADRSLLELFASRGRNMTGYANRKRDLKL